MSVCVYYYLSVRKMSGHYWKIYYYILVWTSRFISLSLYALLGSNEGATPSPPSPVPLVTAGLVGANGEWVSGGNERGFGWVGRSDVSTFLFITMEKGKLAVVADNHVLSHDYGMTLLI